MATEFMKEEDAVLLSYIDVEDEQETKNGPRP